MGHYCRICGRERPNEKFSGKGHRTHVCKDCKRLPAEERRFSEDQEEILDFLDQSNISPKNIERLEVLACSPNPKVAETADMVLQIAKVAPRKGKRLRILARDRNDLLVQLEEMDLIDSGMQY